MPPFYSSMAYSIKVDRKLLNAGTDCTVYPGSYSRLLLRARDGESVSQVNKEIPIVVKNCAKKALNPLYKRFINLRHPNLERIYAVLEPKLDRECNFIAERLERTLLKYDRRHDKSLQLVALDIVNGLEYMHGTLRVAHCDLKENNVMFDKSGTVKIIDFNNCMPEERFGTFALGVVLFKKPPYLFMDPRDWSYNVDMWALGAIVFALQYDQEILDRFLTANSLASLSTSTLEKVYPRDIFNFYTLWTENMSKSTHKFDKFIVSLQRQPRATRDYCEELKAMI